MNELPVIPFTVADAEAAKNLARERMRHETRLVIEFPANAELLAMRPEDLIGSSVTFNGTAMKISRWRETWDGERGLQRFFTAHELSRDELAAREER